MGQAHHNGMNLVVAPGAVPPEQQRRAVLQTPHLRMQLEFKRCALETACVKS